MSSGGVPRYQDLLWPVVLALRELGGSGSIAEIESEVSRQQDFSEEQQSVWHGDGPKTEINYRIDWARTYLKGIGLATNTGAGDLGADSCRFVGHRGRDRTEAGTVH